MPPKKTTTAAVREDTAASSENLHRESRMKRGANHRDGPEEVPVVLSPAIPSVSPLPPAHNSRANRIKFDIESLSHTSLQKYCKVMHLPITAHNDTPSDPPKRFKRVEKKEELVSAVKRHWNGTQCKESEVITSFLYTIKNQDKSFKLRFVETSRN